MHAMHKAYEGEAIGHEGEAGLSLASADEGVSFDAHVLCADGYHYAHDLTLGDRLVTLGGGTAEITGLAFFSRTASPSAPIVEIPEGVLGAYRSTRVALGQSLYLRHFLMSALFGSQEVLAPAGFLMLSGPLTRSTAGVAKFCLIECAAQEIVNVDGLWVATSRRNRSPRLLSLDAQQSEVIARTDAVFRAPRLAS